jgi:5'-nucleotidase
MRLLGDTPVDVATSDQTGAARPGATGPGTVRTTARSRYGARNVRHILVTNDDGIDSAGLHRLARAMAPLGEVTVFAPSRQYSGAGASIGHIGGGVPDVERVERPELDGLTAYAFDGPPALATLLAARGLFSSPPSLVVSGINPGWNIGLAVHFSGTIGAVITAQQLGIPGIAVSQPDSGPQQWGSAAAAAVDVVTDLASYGSDPVALNVNVPNLPTEAIAGTRPTALCNRVPYQLDNARLVPRDNGSNAVTFDRTGPYQADQLSDITAVEAGYISITRLRPAGTW